MEKHMRKERDSNPRYLLQHAGFQDRCNRPTLPSFLKRRSSINSHWCLRCTNLTLYDALPNCFDHTLAFAIQRILHTCMLCPQVFIRKLRLPRPWPFDLWGTIMWIQTDSNRWPSACKADALAKLSYEPISCVQTLWWTQRVGFKFHDEPNI